MSVVVFLGSLDVVFRPQRKLPFSNRDVHIATRKVISSVILSQHLVPTGAVNALTGTLPIKGFAKYPQTNAASCCGPSQAESESTMAFCSGGSTRNTFPAPRPSPGRKEEAGFNFQLSTFNFRLLAALRTRLSKTRSSTLCPASLRCHSEPARRQAGEAKNPSSLAPSPLNFPRYLPALLPSCHPACPEAKPKGTWPRVLCADSGEGSAFQFSSSPPSRLRFWAASLRMRRKNNGARRKEEADFNFQLSTLNSHLLPLPTGLPKRSPARPPLNPGILDVPAGIRLRGSCPAPPPSAAIPRSHRS